MSKVHRLRNTDRIFFVSVNLRHRIAPFQPTEYPLMIDALEGARRRLRFLLCGYVLMPDHWHALIGTRYPLTISQVIHDIKKVSARKLHARRGTEGPIWQHQFWDRFVRHAKEYGDRMIYMHLNPVRKGLVKRPAEWRWSSYNNFALEKTTGSQCSIQDDPVLLPLDYRA